MSSYVSESPTPTQVAFRLADLSRKLEAAQIELVALDEKAVRARQRYEVTFARAFLSAEASNAESRKQLAVLACQDEKLDAEIADAQVRGLRSRLQVLRDQVHVGQSLGAALRSEWNAS